MKESIRKELFDLDCSVDAIERLSRLLYKTEVGSDDIQVSPIGKSLGPESILEGWDKIFQANKHKLNDVLTDIEESNRSKYGPRSIAIPWSERKEGVKSSFAADEGRKIESTLPSAGRLRPIALAKAATYIKKPTNAGLPTMQSKGAVLDDTLNSMSRLLKLNLPCVPFTRTQENNKTRLVWGYPLAYVLDEMRFYRPILEHQRKQDYRAALRTADEIDFSITKLINHAVSKELKLISLDFSSYDDSTKKTLQDYAFLSYFPSLFQNQYHREIAQHGIRYNTVGLVTPDGILRGPHGTPSGSAYTNEVGSVILYGIALQYKEPLEFFQFQGDDAAVAALDPEALKDHFRSYGLNVNDMKSFVSDKYIVYLQNLYHEDYQKDGLIRGIYPTYRALLRIVYQERFNDFSEYEISGKDYYAIRTLSILENVKHHPLFKEFVEYVVKLDKYNLDVSDQGLSSYVKMREKQDGKDVRFTEYKRGDGLGIKSFESFKIARELSVQ